MRRVVILGSTGSIGTQALDVYSDLKTVYINHHPGQV